MPRFTREQIRAAEERRQAATTSTSLPPAVADYVGSATGMEAVEPMDVDGPVDARSVEIRLQDWLGEQGANAKAYLSANNQLSRSQKAVTNVFAIITPEEDPITLAEALGVAADVDFINDQSHERNQRLMNFKFDEFLKCQGNVEYRLQVMLKKLVHVEEQDENDESDPATDDVRGSVFAVEKAVMERACQQFNEEVAEIIAKVRADKASNGAIELGKLSAGTVPSLKVAIAHLFMFIARKRPDLYATNDRSMLFDRMSNDDEFRRSLLREFACYLCDEYQISDSLPHHVRARYGNARNSLVSNTVQSTVLSLYTALKILGVIKNVTARRVDHAIPTEFGMPFSLWAARLKKLNREVAAEISLNRIPITMVDLVHFLMELHVSKEDGKLRVPSAKILQEINCLLFFAASGLRPFSMFANGRSSIGISLRDLRIRRTYTGAVEIVVYVRNAKTLKNPSEFFTLRIVQRNGVFCPVNFLLFLLEARGAFKLGLSEARRKNDYSLAPSVMDQALFVKYDPDDNLVPAEPMTAVMGALIISKLARDVGLPEGNVSYRSFRQGFAIGQVLARLTEFHELHKPLPTYGEICSWLKSSYQWSTLACQAYIPEELFVLIANPFRAIDGFNHSEPVAKHYAWTVSIVRSIGVDGGPAYKPARDELDDDVRQLICKVDPACQKLYSQIDQCEADLKRMVDAGVMASGRVERLKDLARIKSDLYTRSKYHLNRVINAVSLSRFVHAREFGTWPEVDLMFDKGSRLDLAAVAAGNCNGISRRYGSRFGTTVPFPSDEDIPSVGVPCMNGDCEFRTTNAAEYESHWNKCRGSAKKFRCAICAEVPLHVSHKRHFRNCRGLRIWQCQECQQVGTCVEFRYHPISHGTPKVPSQFLTNEYAIYIGCRECDAIRLSHDRFRWVNCVTELSQISTIAEHVLAIDEDELWRTTGGDQKCSFSLRMLSRFLRNEKIEFDVPSCLLLKCGI